MTATDTDTAAIDNVIRHIYSTLASRQSLITCNAAIGNGGNCKILVSCLVVLVVRLAAR